MPLACSPILPSHMLFVFYGDTDFMLVIRKICVAMCRLIPQLAISQSSSDVYLFLLICECQLVKEFLDHRRKSGN